MQALPRAVARILTGRRAAAKERGSFDGDVTIAGGTAKTPAR
jgi:hypothetical protein